MNVPPYTLDIAITSIWIALGLLFVATGLWLARSRLGVAGTFVYAGALLLLAATVFKVHPALVRAPLGEDVIDLQDQLVALRSDRDKVQSAFSTETYKLASKESELRSALKRTAALEQDIVQLRKHLETEQVRAKAAEAKSKTLAAAQEQLLNFTDEQEKTRGALAAKAKKLAQLKIDLNQALEQVKDQAQKIANLEHDIQKERDHVVRVSGDLASARLALQRELERSRALEQRLNVALAEIEKLRSPPEIVPVSPRLTAAKARLDQSIDVNAFSIVPYNIPELTKFTKGACYALALRNRTGVSFKFRSMQFVLLDEEEEFLEAFSSVNGEFLAELQQLTSVTWFVRGKADSGAVIGPLSTSFVRFRKIRYFPLQEGAYETVGVEQIIVSNVENRHLPVLRAAYIAELMKRVDASADIRVLEGLTVPGTDEAQRAVNVFLCIKAS